MTSLRRRVWASVAGFGALALAAVVLSPTLGSTSISLARAFDRIDVGTQLNEITRDETRREAEVTEDMNQQPRRVAARSGAAGQRRPRVSPQ